MPVILQFILGLILISQFKFLIVIFFILFFIKRNKENLVILVLLILFLIRLCIPNPQPNFNNEFTVISSRNNSLLLRQGLNHFRGYSESPVTLGEQILIEGTFEFNDESEFSNYQTINHQYSGLKIKSIQKLNKNSPLKPLIDKVSENDVYNKLLFNQSIEIDSNLLSLLLSSGLLISSMIFYFRKIIGLYFSKKIEITIIVSFLFSLILISGLKFILIRLLIKEILSLLNIKRDKRTLIEMAFCLFLYPEAYTQLVFIFPYYFKLSSFIVENSKYLQLKTSFLMIIIQLTINYKTSLFQSFLFNYFRKLSVVILISSLFTNTLGLFNRILSFVEQYDLTITGKMPWQLSLFIFSLFVFKTQVKEKMVILFVCCLFFFTNTQYNAFIRVVFIDVGQGDATLLIAPFNKEVLLIDTGRKSNYYQLNRTLHQYGISQIDTLIITHDDLDHSENIESLQNDFKIKNLITQKGSDFTLDYFVITEFLSEKSYNNDNDNSLVFKIEFNHESFLFLGDISKYVERELILENPHLSTKVLKLAHHGSKTSSDDYFISSVNPQYAIISSDPAVYNHPSLEVLETLMKTNIINFKTYSDSTITFNYSRWLNWISTSKRFLLIK